jgi:hypothetical protein
MILRRRRSTLVTLLLLTGMIVSAGLWLRAERRQFALDRELIAALAKNDAQKALVLVNSGADPNTPYNPLPPPSLRQLWNYMLHRSPLPTTDSPTAFCIVCGACWVDESGSVKAMVGAENPQLVQSMLQHGVKPNMHDTTGWTPLLYAVFFNHPKTVDLLLDHAADPNLPARDGTMALHVAPIYFNPDIETRLLRAGGKK